MFTGIIAEIGTLEQLHVEGDSARATVRATQAAQAALGDSIAVNGVCLTVVATDGERFSADVMAETLHRSTLGRLPVPSAVNIESAVRVGDRLGGHIVQGHVDAVGTVDSITAEPAWHRIRIRLPADQARYIAEKGSIALNGVSLTVTAVGDDWFEVCLIPQTMTATTLGAIEMHTPVNIETDIVARHIVRWLATEPSSITTSSKKANA